MFKELFSNPIIIIGVIAVISIILYNIYKLINKSINKISMSPFLQTIVKGDKNEFLELINSSDTINAKSFNGDNALTIAAENGHFEIVEILLNKDIDINYKGSNGQTALIKSIINGYNKLSNYLIDKGADINIEDNNGLLALDYECANKNIDFVNKLISLESKISSSALLAAISYNNKGIVEILIKKGVDINAIDSNGDSMIMNAVRKKNIEIIKVLLEKGADLDIRNKQNNTVKDLADLTFNKEVKSLFKNI